MSVPPSFIVLMLLALTFGFLDGFHNSANVVATVITSRAMRQRQALMLAAAAEFVGPFLFGTAVAKTIGLDLVQLSAVTVSVVASAVLAAILWKLITWWPGIPASSSHSLFGGLIGAVLISSGRGALKPEGMVTIALTLVLSPILGLLGGFLIMRLTLFLTRRAPPRINTFFKRGQLFTSVALALTHGSNNAQKVMGMLVLGLVSTEMIGDFETPIWIVASAAGVLALGTALGGQKIMRTVGAKFYTIRPVHGFTAQATSATIILGASLFGGPVSTTQTVSSAIVGVGSAERLSKVRWQVFSDIGLAWVLTFPATIIMAMLLFFPIEYLLGLIG
jgi:PiT family inorganic phosphate transporter